MKVRKFVSILLVLLLLLGLTACGSSAKAPAENMAYDRVEMEAAPAEKPGAGLTTDSQDSSASLPTDRKLIRNIYIEAETEDLTALTDALTARIAALGGYVESKDLRNGSAYSGYVRRTLSMTVRIPTEKADEFVAQVSENSNIVSSTESIDDVTLQYVDTESRVAALQAERDRLMELMDQAGDLSDLLKIEERLTEVLYELESTTAQLRTLDNQVSYATVNLYLDEVKELTETQEQTVWQRIGSGFGENLRNIGEALVNFFVWLVTYSPQLIVIFGGSFLIFRIVRRAVRRSRARKTEE